MKKDIPQREKNERADLSFLIRDYTFIQASSSSSLMKKKNSLTL